MKSEQLLDYVLGQLEGPSREEAEAVLAADPALSARVDRLRHAVSLLADDGEGPEPPSGLASRTLSFVSERSHRRAILDFVPARVPFRWADLAVAAGIFLAGLLTLLPAVKTGREKMSQAECGFNLQELGLGLANYATRHNHYPDVAGGDSAKHVGWFARALEESQLLRDRRALHCPCSGPCPEPGTEVDLAQIDYAYHVGYRDHPSGKAEPVSPWLLTVVPLLADQPSHDDAREILAGNSPNHGRRGQNVLFSDLHLQWLRSRRVGPNDDDLFLNQHRRPEPGVNVNDASLVPADFLLNPR